MTTIVLTQLWIGGPKQDKRTVLRFVIHTRNFGIVLFSIVAWTSLNE